MTFSNAWGTFSLVKVNKLTRLSAYRYSEMPKKEFDNKKCFYGPPRLLVSHFDKIRLCLFGTSVCIQWNLYVSGLQLQSTPRPMTRTTLLGTRSDSVFHWDCNTHALPTTICLPWLLLSTPWSWLCVPSLSGGDTHVQPLALVINRVLIESWVQISSRVHCSFSECGILLQGWLLWYGLSCRIGLKANSLILQKVQSRLRNPMGY